MAPWSEEDAAGGKKEKRKHHIQVYPCFRSGGSLPVPRPAKVLPRSIGAQQKPAKRQLASPVLATQVEEEIESLECEQLCEEASNLSSACDISTYGPAQHLLPPVSECPVRILEAPPAPVKKKQPEMGSCRKHSRCHCNLLSMETPDFFSLPA